MRRILGRMGCALLGVMAWTFCVQAEEISIAFSGQTRAALYPCRCPGDPSGGVARRARIIADLRNEKRSLLLVEAGFSFASGPLDENAQNADLDARRTEVYLKTLGRMGYDALLVSSQEFAFGTDFLKRFGEIPFVSTNTSGAAALTVLKDIGGVKVGIIGLTDREAMGRGAEGWKAPVQVLAATVKDLRGRGAKAIIVLSALSSSDDKTLIEMTPGIDVVINGSLSYGTVASVMVGDTVWVPTWWQTRQLGLLTLDISKKGVRLKELASVSLDAKVADDPEVSKLVPACFSESDCAARPGLIGRCQAPGREGSACVYVAPAAVPVTVIAPASCDSCRVKEVLDDLSVMFGALEPKQLEESDPKAKALLKDLGVKGLPVYVFDASVEAHESFPVMSAVLEKRGGRYIVKPRAAGIAVLLGREPVSKRLDVFYDLSYPMLPDLLKNLKELSQRHPEVRIETHFLAVQDKDGTFLSKGGDAEIEEFRRLAAVEAIAPEKMWDYAICRSRRFDPGWWERCAVDAGLDPARLKERVASPEGEKDLLEKIRLTRELEVASGPTLLVGNRDVFGIVNAPSVEELERVMGRETKKEKE